MLKAGEVQGPEQARCIVWSGWAGIRSRSGLKGWSLCIQEQAWEGREVCPAPCLHLVLGPCWK